MILKSSNKKQVEKLFKEAIRLEEGVIQNIVERLLIENSKCKIISG